LEAPLKQEESLVNHSSKFNLADSVDLDSQHNNQVLADFLEHQVVNQQWPLEQDFLVNLRRPRHLVVQVALECLRNKLKVVVCLDNQVLRQSLRSHNQQDSLVIQWE
jgi:hypothetical protein